MYHEIGTRISSRGLRTQAMRHENGAQSSLHHSIDIPGQQSVLFELFQDGSLGQQVHVGPHNARFHGRNHVAIGL